ncbi:MAG TPA: acyltransferase family protein [Bryobacteraceae bacterium]|nr:acyltransferase family protein [Bryobacteraceae bacterium]
MSTCSEALTIAASTISRYYRPELDVLRLIAFLFVFLVHRMDFLPIDPAKHFWPYNICLLGDFGVPVFFLLSAFLITELLLRENDPAGTIHVKAFYMRRILRIWPLYFAVFFGLVLLARFLHGAGPRAPGSWLAFSFFAGNWYISSSWRSTAAVAAMGLRPTKGDEEPMWGGLATRGRLAIGLFAGAFFNGAPH